MPAQLVALNDGPSILVDKPILLLGRHPECDIQIDSRKISRRHCCIAQVSDYLVVRDLDSTNGVRINGVRVVEGKLRDGDELTIGNHRYRVAWDETAAAPASAPAAPTARTPARGKAAVAPPPPPVPVGPIRPDEDDMLESCDEPVALPDPARPLAPRPAPAPLRPAEDDDSVVLPENGSYPADPQPR